MNAWAYMLRCSDGSYYVGSARGDLDMRYRQHQAGSYPGYTSLRRPVTLVWAEPFQFITDAIAVERQIKGWSRAKKEALIRRDYDVLPKLAARRTRAASAETPPAAAPQDEVCGVGVVTNERAQPISSPNPPPHPEGRTKRAVSKDGTASAVARP